MNKLKCLVIFAVFALILTTNICRAGASGEYPDYLNDDVNYPLVYGHMGIGFYLDESSIIVKEKNRKNGFVIFAENIISFNVDENKIEKTYTVWFNEPAKREAFNVAYVSNNGDSWKMFYIDDTHGYNMSTRNSFLLGWKTIFYYDWPS